MIKKTATIVGKVITKSEVVTIPRANKDDLLKQSIGIETDDGQKVFFEVKPNHFEKVKFIRMGMEISVSYFFSGSEKNGKQYNNIWISEIDVV